jgi:hypothetical protein
VTQRFTTEERGREAVLPKPRGTERHAHAPTTPHKTVYKRWSNTHPVNLRLSIPLLFGRYYLTIVAGRERRSATRRARDRRLHPMLTAGNAIFMFAIGSVCGLALLAAIELVTTSLLGQPATELVP